MDTSSYRTRDNFLVFGQPVIDEAEIQAVEAVLRSRWIGTGPLVGRFEAEFARYRNSPHAIALSSCSAALHLSLVTLGLGTGDEVITTAMTFCATINAIIHAGATPVLADCDRFTMNTPAEAIEAAITSRTKAILVVHFCGLPCDMPAIKELADRYGLRIIEDCAHAIEASIDGASAGTFGDFGCFSFYATKNITTGEGGMVIMSDEGAAARVRMLALHGLSKDAWKRFSDEGYQHYEVLASGFKYNMTDIQAALGLVQLGRIEAFRRRRAEIWAAYDEDFADLPCQLPPKPGPGVVHAHHIYTPLLQLDRLRVNRDRVITALLAENIGVGVHYRAIPQYRYYRERFGWREGEMANAEFIGDSTLTLPLSPGMSDDDVHDVCRAFRRVLVRYSR